MSNPPPPFHQPDTAAGIPVRRRWLAPKLTQMRAGSAEAGSNPIVPEGPIGQGS